MIDFTTSILDDTDSHERRMDLHENPETKTVTATFELPGLKQQDVNVEVHGNRLSISGESKRSENFDKGGYVVQERTYGKFSRTLQIPQGIRVSVLTA
jgi:HSP20 family protein